MMVPLRGKKYRFFYHYFKQKRMMSVHFRGQCRTIEHVTCAVPCETHYQKRQPYLVMRGFAEKVTFGPNTAVIQ